MLPESRRRALLAYLAPVGSATIAEMSKKFHVSSMTIRRDLKLLQQQGQVTLTHGGVIYDMNGAEREHEWRRRESLRAAEKRAIGRYAAAHFVDDGDVIHLDASSTARAMIPWLQGKRGLTITSSSLITLEALHRGLPDAMILGTGGALQADTLSFAGPLAERSLADCYARTAFVSGDGFALDRGLSDARLGSASLKQAMIRAAQRCIVILDASKFGAAAMAQVTAAGDIDALITDESLPEALRRGCRAAGIDLRLASLLPAA